MTRPLRRAHRLIWLVLSLVLPILLAAALWLRDEPRGNPRVRWEQRR